MKNKKFITLSVTGSRKVFENVIDSIICVSLIYNENFVFSNKVWSEKTKKMILTNVKIRFNQDLEKRLPIKNIKQKVNKI